MKKILVFIILSSVLVAGYFFYLRSNPEPSSSLPSQAVRIGILKTPDGAPAYIAAEKKFYEAEGLTPAYTNFATGRAGLEALNNNEIDVALVAQAPLVFWSFSRRDFVVITNISRSEKETKLIARVDKGIQSVKDLQGKKVGVIKNTSAQFFLHSLLEGAGLRGGDVVEVPLDLVDPVAALRSGEIDAVAAYEPYASLITEGMVTDPIWIKVGDKSTETIVSYVVRRGYAQSHPEIVRRLLLATQKSIDWIEKNRQASIQISANLMKLPLPIMESIWDEYKFHLELSSQYLASLDTQARWTANAVLHGQSMTGLDYHDFIDPKPLEALFPHTVTYVH